MARASLRSEPTCAPQPGHGVDPRVLNYLDIDAAVDTSFLQIVQISDVILNLVISMNTIVMVVCLLRFFTFVLPTGLLFFVIPFIFCSETERATTFDFYDHVSVM